MLSSRERQPATPQQIRMIQILYGGCRHVESRSSAFFVICSRSSRSSRSVLNSLQMSRAPPIETTTANRTKQPCCSSRHSGLFRASSRSTD